MNARATAAEVQVNAMSGPPRKIAQRHPPAARHCVSPTKPPARPQWGGPRKTLQTQATAAKNLKNPTRPSDRQAQATEPGVAAAWGARGV